MENEAQNIDQNNSTETFPTATKSSNSNNLLMAGIATLVVIAGLAYYMTTMNSSQPITESIANNQTQEAEVIETPSSNLPVAEEDTAIVALSTQSSSDEIDVIEADINATDLDAVMEYIDQI